MVGALWRVCRLSKIRGGNGRLSSGGERMVVSEAKRKEEKKISEIVQTEKVDVKGMVQCFSESSLNVCKLKICVVDITRDAIRSFQIFNTRLQGW